MVNSRRNPRFVSFRWHGNKANGRPFGRDRFSCEEKSGQDVVVEPKDPLCLLMYQFARRSLE